MPAFTEVRTQLVVIQLTVDTQKGPRGREIMRVGSTLRLFSTLFVSHLRTDGRRRLLRRDRTAGDPESLRREMSASVPVKLFTTLVPANKHWSTTYEDSSRPTESEGYFHRPVSKGRDPLEGDGPNTPGYKTETRNDPPFLCPKLPVSASDVKEFTHSYQEILVEPPD